jgi:hypothetical protein
MLCMFGQLSPLLGDLKVSLLRTGIACSFRPSFGFFGSLPVFFRSFHADALRSPNEFRTPLTLNSDTGDLLPNECFGELARTLNVTADWRDSPALKREPWPRRRVYR